MIAEIKEILLKYTEVQIDNMEMDFVVDLGMSSLDIISFITDVEDKLHIEVPEDEIRNIDNLSKMCAYIHEKYNM